MKNVKKHIKATIALGIVSLLAIPFCHLALTDIFHGETDTSLEWNILRASAVVFIIFIGSTLSIIKKFSLLT